MEKTAAEKFAESDQEVFNHPLGRIEDYSITTQIGRGKYSYVFSGHQIPTDSPVVIKVLKPVRMPKINREIAILEELRGGPNISQLLDIVRDDDTGCISLILNYAENSEVKGLFNKMSLNDIAIYLHGVLKALAYAHKRGIMHRDVKPGNIMWNQETKEVSLIDWGLAEFYIPMQEYQVRVATKYYKGPELLLGYTKYTPSLDIWCLGCTFAGLIFHRLPFFKGKDNNEQIEKMCAIIGGKKMIEYAEKYGIRLPSSVYAAISDMNGPNWDLYINDDNRNLCTEEALDLLNKMLTVDHNERPSAEDVMKHPFFQKYLGDDA